MEKPPTGNFGEAEYWNGPAGLRWVHYQEQLDRAYDAFARAVLAAARLQVGQRVLDVGCGCGVTTLAAAVAVGAGGAVTGIDVAVAMLERARARAAAQGLAPGAVTFVAGDAAQHPFATPFDVVLSRFGVMFFQEPVAAFRHLCGALRPGGRLAFICWRSLDENPWATIPLAAVRGAVSAPPASAPAPGAPGPFAFADRDHVERLLGEAGFEAIDVQPFEAPVVLSDGGVDAAVDLISHIGPAARLLAEVPSAARAAARAAIAEALRPHSVAGGPVQLVGAAWLVTARAP
jgi:SAM-dependent methyltransferase